MRAISRTPKFRLNRKPQTLYRNSLIVKVLNSIVNEVNEKLILNKMKPGFYMQNHELAKTNLMHQLSFAGPKNTLSYSLSRALKLIQSYLSSRKQRTKINAAYSSWKETLFGVPQGFILGPLLFNIFLCDLLWIMCETDWICKLCRWYYTLCFGRLHRWCY